MQKDRQKTIYVAPRHQELFDIATKAYKLGHMPGGTLSSRIASMLAADIAEHTVKLRKAGYKLPAVKGAAK